MYPVGEIQLDFDIVTLVALGLRHFELLVSVDVVAATRAVH